MDFSKKMKIDGTIDKFKAHLVAQGFRKKLGINPFDTYALIRRTTTISLLVALATIYCLEIHQMGVTTAFLYGELDKEVYVKNPKGFFWRDKRTRCIKFLRNCLDLNKHRSTGIKTLMQLYCPLDSSWIKSISAFIANLITKEMELSFAYMWMTWSSLVPI